MLSRQAIISIDGEVAGLGMKPQSTESFLKKMMISDDNDHHRPFSPSHSMGGHDGNGPICKADEVKLGCCTNIYYSVDAARAVDVKDLQQPFDNSTTTITTATSAITNTSFKSPGVMAATLGYQYHSAFTSAQWKELERQAMIYKYMVASVPVPPDLLLPFTPNLYSADSSASHYPLGHSIFNLKLGENKDPEPGRCKRTDGKKWRCSRDVAPYQKYCERHMHRGRPRSRKPVEVPPPNNTNKKTRIHLPVDRTPVPQPTTSPSPHQLLRSNISPNEIEDPSPLALNNTKNQETYRGLDWMMEGEMITMDTSEPQWHQLMTEGSIYNSRAHSIYQQEDIEETINLPSLPHIGCNSHNDEYNLFLKYQPQRDFIDAWSNDNSNSENNNIESSVSGNLSPPSLNLSMAMALGNSLDEEMGQIQMGLAVATDKSQGSSWISPVSWMSSTPGGPLAEVLGPRSVAIGSNPGSPYGGNNGDEISHAATSASSPSGVLQRTMLSLSDSSVSNSPTLAASSAPAQEIVGFQWLS